jgi:SAM-dependent methyltransferase
MIQTPERIVSQHNVSVAELAAAEHASLGEIGEVLPLLASPDTGRGLVRQVEAFTDGVHLYPMRGETLLLLPAALHEHFTDRLAVPPSFGYGAFSQYFLLASIKQHAGTNASADDVHYQRHLWRMKELCRSAQGWVLDVGCDDPRIGASLLPPEARYIGLDPFCMRSEPFRLLGVAEYLPFASGVLDGLMFNTSLDHVLDWRRGLHEAYRVLKPGATLFLCTLVWSARADLLADDVHFHHFREYDIFGALEEVGFVPQETVRYSYKDNDHRHGLYLAAKKI